MKCAFVTTAVTLILQALFVSASFADQALEIAQLVYDRDDGRDSWASSEMVLVDSGGSEKRRKLTAMAKDFGSLSKRYIRFTEPAAIDGTSFLSIENEEGTDEQFLYLPSLGRVRRVSSDQKDRSFTNTTYTYEDMERRKVERDTYKLIGSESFLGKDCWILEKVSKDPDDSQYSKTTIWVDKTSFLVLKSKFYSKDSDKEVKLFEAHEIKKIDQIWTVTQATMRDLINNEKTITNVIKIGYNKGIPDEVFTQKYLEKKN